MLDIFVEYSNKTDVTYMLSGNPTDVLGSNAQGTGGQAIPPGFYPQGLCGQGIPEESLQKTLSTWQLMHRLHGKA